MTKNEVRERIKTLFGKNIYRKYNIKHGTLVGNNKRNVFLIGKKDKEIHWVGAYQVKPHKK
jgi:hypothetical protein